MAIAYLDGGRITGLSTDTKPANADSGSVFIETDTGSKYIHNGTTWFKQPFDSINAALGKDNGLTQRQHFVEWFVGHSLNKERWGIGYSNGTPTYGMVDGIDGGFKIAGGGSHANNNVWLTTHDESSSGASTPIRTFDPNGSVIIDVIKYPLAQSNYGTAGGGFSSQGRGDQATQSGHSDAHHFVRSNLTNFFFRTTNAGGNQAGYGVDSGVAFDNNYHCNKIELGIGISGANYTMDGILKGTICSYMPAHPQAPVYGAQGSNSDPSIQFLYIEAYNF